MKKIIDFSLVLLILLFVSTLLGSCKKDKLQPGWNPFKKKFVIFLELEQVHQNNESHIRLGRTTTSEYSWGGEVIATNGPAGYEPLYTKATAEFGLAFQKELMPDTNELCSSCLQEKIIKEYLELKWDKSSKKAFKKLRLWVPKPLYKVYPRLFERFLSAEMDYLTDQISGNPDWYSGTRDLEREKEISFIFFKDDTDFQDPWGCNCAPYLYILDYYKKYSPGNNKNLPVPENLLEECLQLDFASQRYQKLSSKYGGSISDYQTKYDEKEDVYYIDIPAY